MTFLQHHKSNIERMNVWSNLLCWGNQSHYPLGRHVERDKDQGMGVAWWSDFYTKKQNQVLLHLSNHTCKHTAVMLHTDHKILVTTDLDGNQEVCKFPSSLNHLLYFPAPTVRDELLYYSIQCAYLKVGHIVLSSHWLHSRPGNIQPYHIKSIILQKMHVLLTQRVKWIKAL